VTTAQGGVLGLALTAVVLGVLWTSAQITGQVARRFGEEPHPWQLRMLPFGPFGPFGPVLLWFLLNQRGAAVASPDPGSV
jgi:hypothetical protein